MARPRPKPILAIAALAAALGALGPSAGSEAKPQRVVVYVNEDSPRIRDALRQIEAELRRSGAYDRHRIRLRHVVVDFSRLQETRGRILQALLDRPAAIIAPNPESVTIAKSLTSTIPIVFGSHQDPVAMGIVKSLARPGANVTGLTFFVPVDQKRLEFLRQAAPRAKTLGIVVDRTWAREAGGEDFVAQVRSRLGFESHWFVAETGADLARILATADAKRMDAWYVPVSVLPFTEPGEVVREFNALHRPAVFAATLFAERGGLISYQQQLGIEEALRLLATMVGLILDGVPPGEIPVERPKAFELALNLDAAARLGIALPAALIKRADRVIAAPRAPETGPAPQ
jgi:putative ABC transport system substrate-binding protein